MQNINKLQNLKLNELISKNIIYANKNDTLDKTLRAMQRSNMHIAVVIDNIKDKTPKGIVTIEMLLEELVGEIYDEKDQNSKIKEINQFNWLVSPQVNATYFFNNYFEVPIIVNNGLTIDRFFKQLFNIKSFKINSVYENNELKITVIQENKNSMKNYLFEVNEKTN